MNETVPNMSPAQFTLAILAAPLAMAYVCRLASLSWKTARARYVLIHLCGLFYSGAVMFMQPDGVEILAESLGLGFCACWLFITYPTWRNGPPRHVQSGPIPLDDPEPTMIMSQHGADSRWLR